MKPMGGAGATATQNKVDAEWLLVEPTLRSAKRETNTKACENPDSKNQLLVE